MRPDYAYTDGAVNESIQSIIAPAMLLGRSRISTIVRRLYSDPLAGTADTAEFIAHDKALAARLITIANTVHRGAGIAATSLEAATVRLGHDRTRSLVLSFEIGRMLAGAGIVTAEFPGWWHQAVARGCLARALSMNGDPRIAGQAFLVGAIQDIGVWLMAAAEPETYETLRQRAGGSSTRLATLEWQSFNFNHLHLAMRLLTEWGLRAEIVEAVGRHHTNPPAGATSDRAVQLWQIGYLVGALPIGSGKMENAEALTFRRLLDTAFNIRGRATNKLFEQAAAEYQDIAEVFRPFAAPTQDARTLLAPAAAAMGVDSIAPPIDAPCDPAGESMGEQFRDRLREPLSSIQGNDLPAFVASGS